MNIINSNAVQGHKENSPSFANGFHKTLNLVILRRRLAEDVREISTNSLMHEQSHCLLMKHFWFLVVLVAVAVVFSSDP